jgi:hypothetical protein
VGEDGDVPEQSSADDVADELYALPPEQFVAARDEHVRRARAAGDRELAAALAPLRRPTTSAWVANLLARGQPELLDQLLSLGEELRSAQRELRGAQLRELTANRQRVVAALVQAARRLAAESGHRVSAGTAYEVEQTLNAALADPQTARAVRAGRLVHPAEPAGFGLGADAGSAGPAPPAAAATRPAPRPSPVRERGGADAGDRQQTREQQAEERKRAERERLQAEHDAARADHEVAGTELREAEERVAAVERARDEATARIEALQEQLRDAQQALHETSAEIRDLRRRRDVAARVHTGTAERLARLADRLAALS